MQMKIIHLDSFDDLHSIKDKITGGKNTEILLVWPVKTQLIAGKLDLNLINRYAESLACPLRIVTNTKTIDDYASELKIPVFRSIRKARKDFLDIKLELEIEEPKTSNPLGKEEVITLDEKKASIEALRAKKTKIPFWGRLFSLLIGTLGFVGILAAILPTMKIYLVPETLIQKFPITLQIRPGLTSYSLSGALPTTTYTTIVEGQKEISVTGELTFPLESAVGEIIITNLTDQSFTIPINQIVKTPDNPPIKFITTSDAQFNGTPGERVTVQIQSLDPGVIGNVDSGVIQLLEGDFSIMTTVSNPTPIEGGTERVNHGPADQDYDLLLADLTTSLTQNALDEIRNTLDANDLILSIYPNETKIILQEFSPNTPQPSNSLSLKLQIEISVQAVKHQDAIALGNQLLDIGIEEGYFPTNLQVDYQFNNPPYLNKSNDAFWDVVFFRTIYKDINENQIRFTLSGKPVTELTNLLLQQVSLSVQPKYQISPNWWPWIPISPLNIQFEYDN